MRIFCLLSWLVPLLAALNKSKYNVFKKENGGYVFVRRGEACDLADPETVKELGFNLNSLSTISSSELGLLKKGEPVPSLKYLEPWADEIMRIKGETILAFDPANYWTDSHFLVGHGTFPRSYNPAIVRIKKGKTLFCWRSTDWYSQIQFGWYHHHENHTIVPDHSIRIHNNVVYMGHESPMQDDARLIMLNNNTVVATFSGVFDKQIAQMYSTGTYDDTAGSVTFKNGSTYVLKYEGNQKNWTPFVYNHQLMFFRTLNPVHVVKPGAAPAEMINPADHNVLEVETVCEGKNETHLPWNETLYGMLRGGTPAIWLRGKLFALFHTQTSFVPDFFTYFMGAVSYCPEPPFKMHSISVVPIFKKEMYEGPWDTKAINYVFYPMGVVADEKEGVLHVSAGYQDKNGYMIKLKVDELLATMDVVNECGSGVGKGKGKY